MRIGSDFSISQTMAAEQAQLADTILRTSSVDTSAPPAAPGAAPAAPPPSAGSYTEIPNESSMPDYNQGKTNGCGTTSLAMIMTYLGIPTTQADVDGEIRRTNCFSSPKDLLNYARSKGLEAEGYNHGSEDDIKGYVDKGLPVQILVTADGSGSVSKQHYVDVVGYGTNPDGSQYWKVHNPATGQTETWSEADMQSKWGNTPLGFDHYYNVYAPSGTDLPPSNFDGIQGTLAAAEGIANVANGFDRLIHPNNFGDFVHGMFELPGGVIEALGGGIGGGIQLAANWVHDKLKDIPGLNIIATPFCDLTAGAGAAFSDFFGGIGSGLNDMGGAFGSLFSGDLGGFVGGLWSGMKDVVGGAWDAAGDVVNSVGDAASDVVSSVGDTVSDIGDAIGSLF